MLRRFSIRRRRPSVKTFNVVTLDGTTLSFNLDSRSNGKELLDKVLQECGITSVDKLHFSLATQEDKYLRWILLQKPLKKQLSGHSPYTLLFRVHIYPYNHHSLMQSLTRHYLYLQIKQDLRQNRLQPSSQAAVTRIASLVVQGEVGNYIPQTCSNGYIEELQILPNMTTGMEEAIRQAHRLNRGRQPGECEEEVLDLAQEEPTYGSVYYGVQDSHRQPVTVCVCPVGIRVAQGGRQINCFKWESILKVSNRGKHVHLHMDASQTLAAYQMHYVCPSSQMAVSLASWCQMLVNFYCSIVQEEVNTKSRLKRFFSTRRSLRRGSQVRRQTAYVYPGSNPVQRRSRRASIPGDVQIINKANRSPSHNKKSLEKRSDSKLVIYGLSGLASQADEQEGEQVLPNHHEPSQVLSSASEDGTSDMFSKEELERAELQPSSLDTVLHVIEEEKGLPLGSSSSSLARREERGREERGIGVSHLQGNSSPSRREDRRNNSSNMGSSSSSSLSRLPRDEGMVGHRVGAGPGPVTSSSPRVEKRRGEGGGGGGGDRRGVEQQWFAGSVTDVEHKSVSSLRHVVPGHAEDTSSSHHQHQIPPPLPPRLYDEADLMLDGGSGSGRGYEGEPEKSGYASRQYQQRHHNSRATPRDQQQESNRETYEQRGGEGEYTRHTRDYSHSSSSNRGSQQGSEYNNEGEGSPLWYQNGSVPHSPGRRGPEQLNGVVSPSHHSHTGSSPLSRSYRSGSGRYYSSSGITSPSHHHYPPHRERLSGRSPSTPQIYTNSHQPLPPSSPHHRPTQSPAPHQNMPPTGRASHHHHHHHRPSRHRPHGGSMGDLGRYQHHSHSQPSHPADNPHQQHSYYPQQQQTSGNHPRRQGHHSKADRNTQSPKSNSYNHWQENPGKPSARDNHLSYDSTYQDKALTNGGRASSYNPHHHHPPPLRHRSSSHFPSAHLEGRRRGEPLHSSLRAYRCYSQGDMDWEEQHTSRRWGGGGGRSPAPGNRPSDRGKQHGYHNYQGRKERAHYNGGGAWQEEEEPQSHNSSSLPLHTNPNYSLYEEDEETMDRLEEERAKGHVSSRPRMSAPDTGGHEGRHVSRQHRLRHSTITSLTSLPSDIGGGMSRLGSIASLDYQASFAELSQTDSISGYIDPHVRSLVFEASQNSQGTEL